MNIERRRMLPHLMKELGLPMIAVEVGVAGGSFSQELLEEGVDKIFCLDNWGHIPNVTGDGNYPADFHEMTYAEFKNRFKRLFSERVVELKGLSSEMHSHIPDNYLGMVYHDSSHEYNQVVQDIYYYMPKLIRGGIMAFHDYHNEGYGVKQAVDEYCERFKLTLNHIPEDNPNCASVYFIKK